MPRGKSKHEQLKEEAQEALTQLCADMTVSKQKLWETMSEIAEDLSVRLTALEEETVNDTGERSDEDFDDDEEER